MNGGVLPSLADSFLGGVLSFLSADGTLFPTSIRSESTVLLVLLLRFGQHKPIIEADIMFHNPTNRL